MRVKLQELPSIAFGLAIDATCNHRKNRLQYDLTRARRLGNLYKRKVVLKVRTVEGYVKKVEATVWSFCEDYVSLGHGHNIPMSSVEEIEM